MKKIILLLILYLVSSPAFLNAQYKSEIVKNSKGDYYDKRTGVIIVFENESDMFPKSWKGGKINGTSEDLNKDEIERSIKILNKTFAKYPTQVLKNNLEKVYVLGSLSFYGVGYGGTNSSTRVYLTNKGAAYGYTNNYVEKLFHAEFSSILMRNYPQFLDEKTWININTKGFVYGGSGVEAIREGKSSESFAEELHKEGFLNQYAQSTLENDFNSFAKNIFRGGKKFWELANKHDKLWGKLQLILYFYQALDPAFDEAFFQKVSQH